MKAVIFDLDGTLVDSAPDIAAAANALLRAMGYQPLALDIVRSFIGNGIPKLVERVMVASHIEHTPERHAALTGQFETLYADKPAEKMNEEVASRPAKRSKGGGGEEDMEVVGTTGTAKLPHNRFACTEVGIA